MQQLHHSTLRARHFSTLRFVLRDAFVAPLDSMRYEPSPHFFYAPSHAARSAHEATEKLWIARALAEFFRADSLRASDILPCAIARNTYAPLSQRTGLSYHL